MAGDNPQVIVDIKYFKPDYDPDKLKEEVTKKFKDIGLKPILIIGLFGGNHIWILTEYDDKQKLEKIQNESYVNHIIYLDDVDKLNEKALEVAISNKHPVGYLLLRKIGLPIDEIKKTIGDYGGQPIMSGKINHTDGFSHCTVFVSGDNDIIKLHEIASKVSLKLSPEKWECQLAIKHGWPDAMKMDSKKVETAFDIQGIFANWRKAYHEGKLTPEEISLIENRFGNILY